MKVRWQLQSSTQDVAQTQNSPHAFQASMTMRWILVDARVRDVQYLVCAHASTQLGLVINHRPACGRSVLYRGSTLGNLRLPAAGNPFSILHRNQHVRGCLHCLLLVLSRWRECRVFVMGGLSQCRPRCWGPSAGMAAPLVALRAVQSTRVSRPARMVKPWWCMGGSANDVMGEHLVNMAHLCLL